MMSTVVAPPMSRPSQLKGGGSPSTTPPPPPAARGQLSLCSLTVLFAAPSTHSREIRCLFPSALLHCHLALNQGNLENLTENCPFRFLLQYLFQIQSLKSGWQRPHNLLSVLRLPSLAPQTLPLRSPPPRPSPWCSHAGHLMPAVVVGTPFHQRGWNLTCHWGPVKTSPFSFIFLERTLKKKKPAVE